MNIFAVGTLTRWRAKHLLALGLSIAYTAVLCGTGRAADKPAAVTTPKEHFGFNIGDDYCLANYKQLESYWKKLEGQTDRLKVVSMGKTEEGRDQLMGIVTSPANHAKLPRLKEIARRMARAEVGQEEARKLAEEGKAVVWIDGGLHATEVLCAQMLIETLYQFVSGNDPETLRILDDVIILFVHANPDGMDLVCDAYMNSSPNPQQRRSGGLPRLYQKYAGHDNNRDLGNNLAETKNMNRVMYREWFPQIMFNHHQTGPAGTVLFCPPFRDPSNYNLHPLMTSGLDAVGAAIMQRFLVEDKPGATTRTGAPYATWWNGGLRTTSCFHNIIGLLTETIGNPTPTTIGFNPRMQLPRADYLAPVTPQVWHFRQSVDYSVSSNKAVLDYASRHRTQMLYNIWFMGHDAIVKGSRDNWTISPKVVAAATQAGGAGGGSTEFTRFFRDPAKRDPRAFIVPADQPDFLTATKFINRLIATGVTIHRATADFAVAGMKYPKGSYVVKSAQAFRPHVIDLFEPQDYPDDFAPGSTTPTRPYDIAGWTLAFQMAVQFDRILDGFDGPFEELKDEAPPPPARVANATASAGFFLDTRINDAFRAVNRLQASGEDVRRLQQPFNAAGTTYPAGTFFIVRKATTQAAIEKIANEIGTPFTGSATAPGREAVALKLPRIGLFDTGNSMPAGWTRWILERFEFPYKTVNTNELSRGNLREKFDVLVFVEGGVGGGGGRGGRGAGGAGRGAGGDQPPEQEQSGGNTTANLKKFLDEGGIVFTSGAATGLANQLGLPLGNHLAGLGNDKFFVPGSVLRTRVDQSDWLAWGMDENVDVMFSGRLAFKIPEGDAAKGLKRVAWFDSKTPLRSGWAWGQEHLDGGVAVAEASIGKGRLVLCGPQVLFRAQPDGTFKYLFNSIVQSSRTD